MPSAAVVVGDCYFQRQTNSALCCPQESTETSATFAPEYTSAARMLCARIESSVTV